MNTFSNQSCNKVYESGDCVEFKKFISISGTETHEYVICRGKIIDITGTNLLEIETIDTETDSGEIYWISPGSITEHYPRTTIPNLSLRLVLKRLWKDLIFREVKTVKTKDPVLVTHQYINNSGFVRSEKFRNIQEALDTVPPSYHKNIQIRYRDYYGFTTDRIVRNNDIYYDQEIFFSRKCYGELNLTGGKITAKFPSRRGFSMIPPRKKQYVCGLVGKGEKGLFYRKWFVCSKEFLILWTMICDPTHYSLKNSNFAPKSILELMKELDTSHYNVINNDEMSSEKKKEQYQVYNLENTAIYFPNLYKKIANAVYPSDTNSKSDEMYPTYEEKLTKDLLWMK